MSSQDPNAPKRPTGSWIFFRKEKGDEAYKALVDNNEPALPADVTSKLSTMWKDLSDDEKKVVLSGNGSQFLGIYELDHEHLRDTAANGCQVREI